MVLKTKASIEKKEGISVSVFQDDTYIEDKVTKNCGKNLLAVVLTIISWEW